MTTEVVATDNDPKSVNEILHCNGGTRMDGQYEYRYTPASHEKS